MTIIIDRDIKDKKKDLLDYYRSRAQELSTEVRRIYADTQFKERASAVNTGVLETKSTLIKSLVQKADKEDWTATELLEGVLIVTYTGYVVMMETRNEVWPYEYMTFARRIGELWEPFCQLPWSYPLKTELSFFVPPLFRDVKEKLTNEIETFIDRLVISKEDKDELKAYYRKVWTLVTSGEIKLELDLHFEDGKHKYVVDFKSGFSSNEKGNTNRLLLVASIYKILEENYECLIFVRSDEEKNNHYLKTLKNSGLWTVYCGKETLQQIKLFTGFDLLEWLSKNVSWESDFDNKMYAHLKQLDLLGYLVW